MIICECMGIDDHDVLTAIQAGARTVEEIGELCAAGTGCGGCQDVVQSILTRVQLARENERPELLPPDLWAAAGLA